MHVLPVLRHRSGAVVFALLAAWAGGAGRGTNHNLSRHESGRGEYHRRIGLDVDKDEFNRWRWRQTWIVNGWQETETITTGTELQVATPHGILLLWRHVGVERVHQLGVVPDRRFGQELQADTGHVGRSTAGTQIVQRKGMGGSVADNLRYYCIQLHAAPTAG